ncbi:CHAT domain-containing tetratricopeptide repeat protein [Bernardetia sp. ABR2-2B]|uniref:CHAT domain-containing protein n=1 Tax=Bernardetia sp. ABR2-2B TaxID=3127472 RepID=UPI0030D45B9A
MKNYYFLFLIYSSFFCLSTVFAQSSSINYNPISDSDSLATQSWDLLLEEANYAQARYDYKSAIQLYKNLQKQTLEKDSIYFFEVNNQFASLYQQQGNYAEAEILLSQCLNFNDKKFGSSSLQYAQSCNDLAVIYRLQGKYKKSENLHLKAREIQKIELTKLSIPYATSCLNLAQLYKIGNRYDKSELYLIEASNIFGHLLGRNHPSYAGSLVSLADYHIYKNRFAMAETALTKARQIYAENYSKQNLEYANTCTNLAKLYTSQDNYQKALSLYKEVENIYATLLSKKHPDYIFFLNSFAIFYQKYGFYGKAQPLFIEVIETKLEELQSNFYSLSEKEKLAYIESNEFYFDNFTTFFVQMLVQKPDYLGFEKLLKAVVTIQIARKGILLNENKRIQKYILSSKNQKLIDKYEEWKQTKHQIALGNNLTIRKRQELHLNLAELESLANGLEKQLSALSNYLTSQNINIESYTLENLQNSLNPEEAAIEILKNSFWDAKTRQEKTMYIALIVKKSEIIPVLITDINEEKELTYYRNTIQFQLENEESYKKLWFQIDRKLDRTKKIYFSPNGIYNFINLYTLYNPATKSYLIDKLTVHSVTSLREIIENKEYESKGNTGFEKTAVLMGRPNYLIKNSAQDDTENTTSDDRGSVLSNSLQLSTEIFTDLKQTEQEVRTIDLLLKQNNWKTEVFLKSDASEETLKQVFNPTILHIATHGYFKESKNQTALNSMLGAGIVLAKPKDNNQAEDGIFTAYEASLLELQKTELVVISACETGLGKLASQEGVYGLQRGFRAAGAKNVLLSLWKVDDKATQELMTIFYAAWFEGKTKPQALRAAQFSIKQKYQHPYYWGAFVLVGK